ncbi:hypothetical protein B0H63DRAFT_27520 [Podospora didyma]|uniref:Uncharacterized protein n=1 Tax=Podospora didyma TaxID=330526 RepID=A0AAE0P6B8_9PEZI|nr:hypothetical protein B0H63DRAFT_27520 [Podospora didyma]
MNSFVGRMKDAYKRDLDIKDKFFESFQDHIFWRFVDLEHLPSCCKHTYTRQRHYSHDFHNEEGTKSALVSQTYLPTCFAVSGVFRRRLCCLFLSQTPYIVFVQSQDDYRMGFSSRWPMHMNMVRGISIVHPHHQPFTHPPSPHPISYLLSSPCLLSSPIHHPPFNQIQSPSGFLRERKANTLAANYWSAYAQGRSGRRFLS